MINWLVQLPNNIVPKQKYYQANAHRPMWRTHPRSGILLPMYYTLFTGVMAGSVYGAYQLVFGKPEEAS
ncbi:hypothetical protein FIBSPDRAFT_953563 [Athelia psychrophila]|uniref:Uncharacterized protein n=1 Tax=Athelia psychrophila TaxID=1759441 RepID=A0A166K547_9AGAM|nr:hypothetical protein FIBSPDRAFT_953563 [Fibularhizoctonia sp. CBS 109695]